MNHNIASANCIKLNINKKSDCIRVLWDMFFFDNTYNPVIHENIPVPNDTSKLKHIYNKIIIYFIIILLLEFVNILYFK